MLLCVFGVFLVRLLLFMDLESVFSVRLVNLKFWIFLSFVIVIFALFLLGFGVVLLDLLEYSYFYEGVCLGAISDVIVDFIFVEFVHGPIMLLFL